MSFFGFETNIPRPDAAANQSSAEEDIAIYTWGDVSYDTLGDALQEAGDDLNDETFGSDPVGKDFDFSGNSEAIMRVHPSAPPPSTAAPIPASAIEKSAKSAHNDIWASKDPTAALFKSSGTNRAADVQSHKPTQSVNAPSVFSQLDPLVAPGTDARQSYQAITTPSMPHATPSQPIGGNHSVPRTMADIEAEMQAALRKQQLLAQQQQEFERRQQAEQQQQQILLREQLLQQEERRLFEQEQARLREQQALMQDPLRAIRQAMGEGNGMMPPSHEPRHSIGSGGSPMVQHRQAMSASHPMQPVPTGPMGPAPQELILQELLYQQQQMQQRFIQQRGQQQPFDMDKPDALAATEAQLRMQEAEAKHRRRMAKIQSMARYNDLMTQSDKDFITRVQVAQLVTSDPYAEDFYAQVYASIRQQRNSVDGDGGKVAHGPSTGGGGRPHRRENAMQRMQAQVERLVNNMKNRELNKENAAPTAALQNALGKTSGRSYRAAPRQLLQVAIASPESQKAHSIKEHEPDKAADHAHAHGNELPPPFSQSEGLLIVERLFTNILDIEQLRRNRPSMEDEAALETWNTKLRELLDQIWQALRVSGPLYETNPHPFIALITPLKGKRFIGRLGRDLTDDQKLMTLGVIVNRIEQVDVIRNSSVLDSIDDSRERRNMEKQAFAFQEYVVNQGLQLSPAMRTLKTYTALIEMMMEDGAAFARVVRTRPGLILLEHFFAEASLLKHGLQGPDGEPIPPPPEAVVKWASLYDRLFEYLLPLWTVMFPSSRILPAFPPDSLESIQVSLVTDGFDQHVWRFLAGFALEGTQEQHSRLVTQLRAKVMGTLKMAQRLEEGKAKARKIRNVDLFLNALGLSSSQIPLQ